MGPLREWGAELAIETGIIIVTYGDVPATRFIVGASPATGLGIDVDFVR